MYEFRPSDPCSMLEMRLFEISKVSYASPEKLKDCISFYAK